MKIIHDPVGLVHGLACLGSPLAVHLHFRPVAGFRPATLIAVLDIPGQFGLHAEVPCCRPVGVLDTVGQALVFLLGLPVAWGPGVPQVLYGGDPFVGGDVAPAGIHGGQGRQSCGHLMLDVIISLHRIVRGIWRLGAVLDGYVVISFRGGLGAGWDQAPERIAHVAGLAHGGSCGIGQGPALIGVLAPLTGECRQRYRTNHDGQYGHCGHSE